MANKNISLLSLYLTIIAFNRRMGENWYSMENKKLDWGERFRACDWYLMQYMWKASIDGYAIAWPRLSTFHCDKHTSQSENKATASKCKLFARCNGMLSGEIVHFICWYRLGWLDIISARLSCILLPGIVWFGSCHHVKWIVL